jgi:hypothetical protein
LPGTRQVVLGVVPVPSFFKKQIQKNMTIARGFLPTPAPQAGWIPDNSYLNGSLIHYHSLSLDNTQFNGQYVPAIKKTQLTGYQASVRPRSAGTPGTPPKYLLRWTLGHKLRWWKDKLTLI